MLLLLLQNLGMLGAGDSVVATATSTTGGMAIYAEGDSEDTSAGLIALRSGDTDSGEGIAVDIVDTVNNVFMVYRASPKDVALLSDDPDFPDFVQKYIAFGVISRAYGANTDGRIKSLSDYWGRRYEIGVKATKHYMLNKRQDRDYRLTTSGSTPRRFTRGPKLPSTYPSQ